MKPPILFRVDRRIRDSGAWGSMWYLGGAADIPICVTLERTYETGKRIKIRDGIWHCTRRRYNKGQYDTWEIHIPDHDYILVHKANWEKDLDGCLGVAEQYHDFDPKSGIQDPGIGKSRAAFYEFMSLTVGAESFFIHFVTLPEVDPWDPSQQ